ncbi:hypothetical protein [Paenibacillus sedimenti]|uniref:Multi-tm2 domain protein n=1 Tax=Paenibacillus sedimenti TaxID=2770274 RepID=A0A926KYB3_9BACL|nr:hypothetical protein [Paenibacillus sedimenti]MBD0384359.1 hypothetical protein [Paenibacillus sedimenti]
MKHSNNLYNKSSLIAFLLSVIPGLGHFYMNRMFRAFIYGGGFFGSLFLIFLCVAVANGPEEIAALLALFAALMWIANMVDMIIFLLRLQPYPPPGTLPYGSENPYPPTSDMPPPPEQAYWESATSWANQRERTRIMLLSFIPGLGHYQLGLMQRGLTAMITFFGIAILVFFITILTHNEGFIAFLLAMPVLLFYSMFDALKQLERKQAGFELFDRSMFEDFHFSDDYIRKNRTLATIIAIIPGAAHLYLNMTKRGIQLMAVFLFSVYVLDVLRLSLFFFLIPILWFFSFFDALQNISRYENGTLVDKPLVENWTSYNRSIGAILIVLGGYYLFKEVIVQLLYRFFPHSDYMYWINNFGQTLIVAVILIGAGIRLLIHRKKPIDPPAYLVDTFEIDEKKNP